MKWIFEEASKRLEQEECVILPTETVYGLGARIDSEKALKKIFELKNRPFFDPLIVHVATTTAARELSGEWNELCQRLADFFWPGPLTLVLPKKQAVSDLITAGLPSVGLRVPKHPFFRRVLRKLKQAIAAPSANQFTKTSPSLFEDAQNEFVNEKLFGINGGPCQVGIESTVLKIQNQKLQILRKGMITKQQIEAALRDLPYAWTDFSTKDAPGQMNAHYQPAKAFYLISENEKPPLDSSELVLSDDPLIAARLLYRSLRELAHQEKTKSIYFRRLSSMTDPRWEAIFERLEKAQFRKD